MPGIDERLLKVLPIPLQAPQHPTGIYAARLSQSETFRPRFFGVFTPANLSLITWRNPGQTATSTCTVSLSMTRGTFARKKII